MTVLSMEAMEVDFYSSSGAIRCSEVFLSFPLLFFPSQWSGFLPVDLIIIRMIHIHISCPYRRHINVVRAETLNVNRRKNTRITSRPHLRYLTWHRSRQHVPKDGASFKLI